MPRLVKSVPKYAKHKASGQAIVRIGGQCHYLGPHDSATSVAEYDRLIAEYLASKRCPTVVNEQQMLVVNVLELFMKHAATYYVKDGQATSEYGAFKRVSRSIRRLYGEKSAAEFGPLCLKAVRETWVQAGLARKSINQHQGRVIRIFKWAVSEQLIDESIWRTLTSVDGLKKGRSVARDYQPVAPVDLATVEATIPHLSPVVAAMVRMQLLTGMRPGEVCRLSPGEIDRSKDVWEYRPSRHKTEHHGRDRVIYFGPQAQLIISPYLFRDPSSQCFSARESIEWFREQRSSQRKTSASTGNARGRRSGGFCERPKRIPRAFFDASSYGHAIALACKKAWPVPEQIRHSPSLAKTWRDQHKWAPNQIRHTRGTEIRSQFGLEEAQIILGHASADVTQIYAERDAEKARDVARRIG